MAQLSGQDQVFDCPALHVGVGLCGSCRKIQKYKAGVVRYNFFLDSNAIRRVVGLIAYIFNNRARVVIVKIDILFVILQEQS